MRPHNRSFLWRFTLPALAAAGMLLPSATAAQQSRRNSATLIASATVVTGRLGAASVRGLEFGRVLPGTPVTVAADGRTAATWRLSGTANAPVQVAFELPEVVTRDGGAATLPIRFGRGAGRWVATHDTRSFDPATGAQARFGAEAAPVLEVRLGATVAPAAGTPGGAYRGAATLTVLYL